VEIMYERVAAIDVGKKIIAVAVRTPDERAGKRRQQVRKYSTFHQTLATMVAWLVAEGVTHMTMEATEVLPSPPGSRPERADPTSPKANESSWNKSPPPGTAAPTCPHGEPGHSTPARPYQYPAPPPAR
jgi:hypothetical protein